MVLVSATPYFPPQARAFMDRTHGNSLGIHFYDDAGGLAQPVWHLGTGLDEAAH